LRLRKREHSFLFYNSSDGVLQTQAFYVLDLISSP